MTDLVLKRVAASRGEAYDVLRGRRIVGRIQLSDGSPASRWAWMLAYKYHEGRLPTHGYEASRDDALKAFARSWYYREPS
jgi:hypothetical protein